MKLFNILGKVLDDVADDFGVKGGLSSEEDRADEGVGEFFVGEGGGVGVFRRFGVVGGGMG